MDLHLLRAFIREQVASGDLLGARSLSRTMDTEPFTFEDYEGYDINIAADVHHGYALTVTYNEEKISPMSVYQDYEEANHQARMIIDKHRVKAASTSGKKKKI